MKIKYILTAENATEFKQRLKAFELLHNQPGYRTLEVEAFNRTFELRTLGFSGYRQKGGLLKAGKKTAKIEVTYSMDDPLQYFIAYNQVPNLIRDNLAHVKLNDYDFSKFGIIIRQAYNTLLQPSSPKRGIVWNSKYKTGLVADTNFTPKLKSRKLVLECTMITDTYEEFEYNYAALFIQLTKPKVIEISIETGKIPCFYDKMSNFKKKKTFRKGAFVTFNLELITL